MKRIILKTSSQPFEKQNSNQNKQISFKPMQQPIHHVNLPLSPPPSIDNVAFVNSFIETVKCTTGRTNISKLQSRKSTSHKIKRKMGCVRAITVNKHMSSLDHC